MGAGARTKKHIGLYGQLNCRRTKKEKRSESAELFLIEPEHTEIDQADDGIEQNRLPPSL